MATDLGLRRVLEQAFPRRRAIVRGGGGRSGILAIVVRVREAG
jgi:hypothetical protein